VDALAAELFASCEDGLGLLARPHMVSMCRRVAWRCQLQPETATALNMPAFPFGLSSDIALSIMPNAAAGTSMLHAPTSPLCDGFVAADALPVTAASPIATEADASTSARFIVTS